MTWEVCCPRPRPEGGGCNLGPGAQLIPAAPPGACPPDAAPAATPAHSEDPRSRKQPPARPTLTRRGRHPVSSLPSSSCADTCTCAGPYTPESRRCSRSPCHATFEDLTRKSRFLLPLEISLGRFWPPSRSVTGASGPVRRKPGFPQCRGYSSSLPALALLLSLGVAKTSVRPTLPQDKTAGPRPGWTVEHRRGGPVLTLTVGTAQPTTRYPQLSIQNLLCGSQGEQCHIQEFDSSHPSQQISSLMVAT